MPRRQTVSQLLNTRCPVNWAHPLNTGLVAEWAATPDPVSFGSRTFYDLVRGAKLPHNGTLNSGVSWVGSTRSGEWGAVSLNGTTGFIDMGTASRTGALNFSAQDFSFAFWCKESVGAEAGFALCKTSGSGTNGYDFSFAFNGLNGQWGWRINSGTAFCQASSAYNDGKWHFVVCTYVNATLAQVMYIDSKNVAGATANNAVAGNSSASFQLGARNGASITTACKLNDVMAWNRALSAAEAMALYQEGLAGNPTRWNWLSRREYPLAAAVATALPEGWEEWDSTAWQRSLRESRFVIPY